MLDRLRWAVGTVRGAVSRARWLGGALVGTAFGAVGLVLGVGVLYFAVTAPVTSCATGGAACPSDVVTLLDGLARWLGAVVLLYAGGSTLVRAWR